MLNFGDLFFADGKEYVYLFSDGERIFAAIIVDQEVTKQLKALGARADRHGQSHKSLVYCYVELSTEEYVDCAAHMVQTQEDMPVDTTPIFPADNTLNEEDLIEIRSEILETPELFNEGLVEHVRNIRIGGEESGD